MSIFEYDGDKSGKASEEYAGQPYKYSFEL